MEHAHTRALDALEPFIHLANSNSASSPRFLVNLITNATSSPHTYVFSELLETPAIRTLHSQDIPEESRAYHKLLEIFAWGTWQEYQTTPNLPSLNVDQTLKLRLLTLVSLAASVKPLTYGTLMSSLSISSPAELESLVTEAIYSSLIVARLSPTSDPPMVNVTAVAPLRDVNPQSLTTMITVLSDWETRCVDIIREIEAEISNITAHGKKRQQDVQAHALLVEKTLASRASEKGVKEGLPDKKAKHAGSKFGTSSGTPGNSNKREFRGDDGDDGDDGYWDNENGMGDSGSKMDIDDGSAASSLRSGNGSASGVARQAKRLLGRKTGV